VLRGQLRAMAIDDTARFEIDFRLRQKEREFQQAALAANSIRVEALADDGVVVRGQPLRVSIIVANHGDASVGIKQIKLDGFEGDTACTLTAVTGAAGPGGGGRGGRGGAPAPTGPAMSTLTKDQVGRCDPTVKIPASARVTEPYWHREGDAGRYAFDADAPFGLPYRPTSFYAQVTMTFPPHVTLTEPVRVRFTARVVRTETSTTYSGIGVAAMIEEYEFLRSTPPTESSILKPTD